MRINVYSEELTADVVIVHKTAGDTHKRYHGCRLYLESAPALHNSADDDDRSAITIWFSDPVAAQAAVNTLGVIAEAHRAAHGA